MCLPKCDGKKMQMVNGGNSVGEILVEDRDVISSGVLHILS